MSRDPNEPTLRRWAVVAFTGATAAAVIAVACSSFEEGGPSPADGDAGDTPDAAGAAETSDAVPPNEGGLVPTPRTFACFESDCDLTKNHCCYADKTGPACKESCAREDNFDFQCDDAEDCGGRRCCFEIPVFTPSGTFCKTSCDANIQLCATNEECPLGTTCVAKECRGRLVGTCGDVDITAFCRPDAGPDAAGGG